MTTDRKSPTVSTSRTNVQVLAWCSANALITTVHHVYGAVIYGTPGRYHAVLAAALLLALDVAAYAWARRPVAWWIHWSVSLVGFVLSFGLFEGLYTHVLSPLLQGGYMTPGQPFDLLFQATGVLHVLPAAVTALLLVRLLRERGQAVTS
ncbi:hypothetical protein [Nonomuraea bangladeshensis]|uniref:hypothetical protein n=1 Tax=Nonomuraea bangladeshensis TaxID=404385 RepID=UPI0031D8587A